MAATAVAAGVAACVPTADAGRPPPASSMTRQPRRDFASLLPVTLVGDGISGRDAAGALRPRAVAVAAYQAGDLGYWSPGHDLAIYYRRRRACRIHAAAHRHPDQLRSPRPAVHRPRGAARDQPIKAPRPNPHRKDCGEPHLRLHRQVAFVTGASSGMGLATARAFAEAGAAVDPRRHRRRRPRPGREATYATPATASSAVHCDVTDEDQVAAAVGRTVETFGRLDMAFNNAGIQTPP